MPHQIILTISLKGLTKRNAMTGEPAAAQEVDEAHNIHTHRRNLEWALMNGRTSE